MRLQLIKSVGITCVSIAWIACRNSEAVTDGTTMEKSQSSTSTAAYVVTPAGLVDPSKVHRVADGDVVGIWQGRLQTRTLAGSVVTDFGPTTALQDAGAHAGIASGLPIPSGLGHGWIAYATWNRPSGSGNAITHDTTWWVVPPAPTTTNGQIIYLFNGLQDDSGNIIQPVLQWGSTYAGGGNYWAVACWAVYAGGEGEYTGGLITEVSPGDTVVASVDSAVIDGSPYYSCHFNVPGTGELLWYDEGHEFPQAVETLEAYNMTECSDYPDTLLTAFMGISIKTHNGTPTIAWTPHDSVTDCGQFAHIVSDANPGGEVDIYYHEPPPPPPPPLTASISGPTVTSSKCTCTWYAMPSGGVGAYSYQWTLQVDGGSRTEEGTDSTQSFTVESGDPSFWWILSVSDGSHDVTDSIQVTNCIGVGGDCGEAYLKYRGDVLEELMSPRRMNLFGRVKDVASARIDRYWEGK